MTVRDGRILAVDYGSRRIGLAICDPTRTVVTGLPLIETKDPMQEVGRIAEIAEGREVAEIVVGLPLNMNDTVGPRARLTLAFVEQLRLHVRCPVETFDERLTSFEAEERLRGSGLGRKAKRRHVNTVAAQIILETYLAAKKKAEGDRQ